MFSKFGCVPYRMLAARRLLAVPLVCRKQARSIFGLIPRSQYDTPFPKRLQLGYVIRKYWEICPVIAVTSFALFCMILSIIWACLHKVDAVYTSRSRNNISRTMDLRNPTIHKIFIINQKYEPWPEMAELLDKMKLVEKKAANKLEMCPQVKS